MTTAVDLIRTDLIEPFKRARNAHPGLLLQRGYPKDVSGDDETTKTPFINRICRIPAPAAYGNAYRRWLRYTAEEQRFAGIVLALDTRLLIGLSGAGMLETGCAIQHSYGVPYIPGSSVKGVVSAFARRQTGFSKEACDELFGAEAQPDALYPDGLSGVIAFHDACWVPDSAPTPLVSEVVTTHHPKYYASEGGEEATDFDSPIPNAQIGVRGSFLFVIEGPGAAWLDLSLEMLKTALQQQGIGAKTRAGYGYFSLDAEHDAAYRRSVQEVRAEVILERERMEKAREAAVAQSAFDALSPEGQQLHRTEMELERYLALGEVEQRAQRSELIATLNRLSDAAQAWPTEERRNAADLLARAYDTIGWFDPGRDKKKRQKQEDKRRKTVEGLRG